jgi:saccharopine dehydrogenase-like NADP-dependent oxidoreductase
MTAMMRTTAWPASIVVQMLASGTISKRGAIYQEIDVPFEPFCEAMSARGISMKFSEGAPKKTDLAGGFAGA